MYDLNATTDYSMESNRDRWNPPTPDTTGLHNHVWDPDEDEDKQEFNQDNIIKAELNPASPFIALPKKLFEVIAEKWTESFAEEERPICVAHKCLVFKSCDKITTLKDFGLRLGSLNDSQPEDTPHKKGKDDEVINKLDGTKEIHESHPMFFKIPTSSYLIPGPRLGLEEDICHLAITGTIPDEINSVVLGQPFLENYFVVLDQEDMKIGLGAHLGSDA